MMGNVNKTDKLDANGLATLLRIGSLPTVWLPPAKVRDERELPRTRMALCNMRTALTSSRCPSGKTASTQPSPSTPSPPMTAPTSSQ
jgi:hypothetical protein